MEFETDSSAQPEILTPRERVIPNDVFQESILGASADFDTLLRDVFSPSEYKAIRTIGAFIMRGLSLEESCILARVGHIKLMSLMASNEDVKNFIIFKQIAYKAVLLNTLTGSAFDGESKSAGYLLEKKYPKEFDKKKGDDEIREPDIIERAIQFVRNNAHTQTIVKPKVIVAP